MTRRIDSIIIHCSATEYGNVPLFRKWHKGFGWDDIGYHFVINNSYPTRISWDKKKPFFDMDGNIEIGRNISKIGAHTKKHNIGSIGICLVGDRTFTKNQYDSLNKLIITLSSIYKIKEIKGHYEYDTAKEQGKTCPNIDMDWLRSVLLLNKRGKKYE